MIGNNVSGIFLPTMFQPCFYLGRRKGMEFCGLATSYFPNSASRSATFPSRRAYRPPSNSVVSHSLMIERN